MSILTEKNNTDKLMLDYLNLWDEFSYKSIEDSKALRYYRLLMNLIDNQLDAGIRWLDSDDARDYFFGETEYQREVFRGLEDEWDEILQAKYDSVDALLSEVYRRGKSKGYSDMRSRIRYTEADKQALRFLNEYNVGLIQRIDNDVRTQIKYVLTKGEIAGEHPHTLAPQILNIAEEQLSDSIFTPKQRATMIARTEVSRSQNTGILQAYVDENYTEVKILTAEDDHVCATCLYYAYQYDKGAELTYANRGIERVHNIKKLIEGRNFPPFHPLCRCTYLAVWESKNKLTEKLDVVNLTIDNSKYIEELLNNGYHKYTPKGRPHGIYIKNITGESELFRKSLLKSKATNTDLDKWRVDVHDAKDYDECELFITDQDSTIAIKPNGDIISVCASQHPKDSGEALLRYAVAKGGIKLDSYDGNYKFYRKCGFEPVSYCEFDEEFAPEGWKKERDRPEDIIFFKYTGNLSEYEKVDDFYDVVDASEGDGDLTAYDVAEKVRDDSL